MKWICKVCGYVYEGDSLPADFKCPVCKAPASAFMEVQGEMPLAAEHEFGVYAKTVKNNKDIPDDVKKEMVVLASMIAGKVVSASIDTKVQDQLVDEALKEIGESTWQN